MWISKKKWDMMELNVQYLRNDYERLRDCINDIKRAVYVEVGRVDKHGKSGEKVNDVIYALIKHLNIDLEKEPYKDERDKIVIQKKG